MAQCFILSNKATCTKIIKSFPSNPMEPYDHTIIYYLAIYDLPTMIYYLIIYNLLFNIL